VGTAGYVDGKETTKFGQEADAGKGLGGAAFYSEEKDVDEGGRLPAVLEGESLLGKERDLGQKT